MLKNVTERRIEGKRGEKEGKYNLCVYLTNTKYRSKTIFTLEMNNNNLDRIWEGIDLGLIRGIVPAFVWFHQGKERNTP